MPKKTATSPRNSTTTLVISCKIFDPNTWIPLQDHYQDGGQETEVATKEITTVKTTKTAKTSTAIVDVKPQDLVKPAPPIPVVASNCWFEGKRVPSQVTDSRKKKSQSRQDHGNNPQIWAQLLPQDPTITNAYPQIIQDLHNELIR
jgi:hypothetical protein